MHASWSFDTSAHMGAMHAPLDGLLQRFFCARPDALHRGFVLIVFCAQSPYLTALAATKKIVKYGARLVLQG